MQIQILKAKNGEDTASVDGHFLHSNYAPKKEAERFVENLKLPYTPSSIIISEPALSYIAEYLRKKFPGIKLGVIRYNSFFSSYNSAFDFVLDFYSHSDFETYLETKLSEEELLTAFFVSWTPSAQIFKDEDKNVWLAIKAAMERAKTLLITRQYFEKKWFLNSCKFLKNLHTVVNFQGLIEKDLLIISSGPSLRPYLQFIRENQNSFFIICLSSAISLCLANKIIPDLCMTSDGGFWAGEHLKKLKKYDIALAMPAEAYCPQELFSHLKILPLKYGEGISKELMEAAELNCKNAVRNGTVSGTALLFGIQYFTKNIFMCGLDMAPQTGYQHTQPNELETNSAAKDFRLSTKEGRLARAELAGSSLDIYRSWFSGTHFKLDNGRGLYRLIEKENRKNNLGEIKDINLDTFRNMLSPTSKKQDFFTERINYNFSRSNILKLFNDSKRTDEWKKQLFPLDYVLLSHNPSSSETLEKIETEWKQLKKKAEDILNENI